MTVTAPRYAVPFTTAFDSLGVVSPGAQLFFYLTGSSTPANTYADSGLVTPNPNPVVANGAGLFGNIFIEPGLIYKVVLETVDGDLIWTADPVLPNSNYASTMFSFPTTAGLLAAFNANFVLQNGVMANTAGRTSETDGGGGTFYYNASDTTSVDNGGTIRVDGAGRRWYFAGLIVYVGLFGVVSDGSDQTSAIEAIFSALPSFRGNLFIPYGTKFNMSQVYAAAPVGYILLDESSINTGQPPGYKNKVTRIASADTASDDSSVEINSAYHPVLRLNNMHTAAGSNVLQHSMLWANGIRWNNDPIDGYQNLVFKSPRSTGATTSLTQYHRWALFLNTIVAACLNPQKWTGPGTVFAANALCNTDDNNVYQTTLGGTTGSTKPTGTGSGINDGGVIWNYVSPWDVGRTVFYVDDDGHGAISGPTVSRFGTETINRFGISLNTEDASGNTYLKNDDTGKVLLLNTTAGGVSHGTTIPSLSFGANLSGGTPTITNEAHIIVNGAGTNMTNLLMGGGQTEGYVTLIIGDSNTIIKATGFNLKGNVDIVPANYASTPVPIVVFMKNSSFSASWSEVSRNF